MRKMVVRGLMRATPQSQRAVEAVAEFLLSHGRGEVGAA